MKNTITISAEFFYKGQKLSPSVEIDLDEHIRAKRSMQSLYPLLAKSNNIDLYSYEYEMLQAEDLAFSEAKGMAASFLNEGVFDIDAFEQALHDQKVLDAVAHIARTVLSVDDLDSQPVLKTALIEAYKLGQKS